MNSGEFRKRMIQVCISFHLGNNGRVAFSI